MAILSKLSIIATHVAQSSLETYNESVFLETQDEVLKSVAALQMNKSTNTNKIFCVHGGPSDIEKGGKGTNGDVSTSPSSSSNSPTLSASASPSSSSSNSPTLSGVDLEGRTGGVEQLKEFGQHIDALKFELVKQALEVAADHAVTKTAAAAVAANAKAKVAAKNKGQVSKKEKAAKVAAAKAANKVMEAAKGAAEAAQKAAEAAKAGAAKAASEDKEDRKEKLTAAFAMLSVHARKICLTALDWTNFVGSITSKNWEGARNDVWKQLSRTNSSEPSSKPPQRLQAFRKYLQHSVSKANQALVLQQRSLETRFTELERFFAMRATLWEGNKYILMKERWSSATPKEKEPILQEMDPFLQLAKLGRDRQTEKLDVLRPAWVVSGASGGAKPSKEEEARQRVEIRNSYKSAHRREVHEIIKDDGDARKRIIDGERHLLFHLLSSSEILAWMSEPTRKTWGVISGQGGCHVTRYINYIETADNSSDIQARRNEHLALLANDNFLLALLARRVYAPVEGLLGLLDDKKNQHENRLRDFLFQKEADFDNSLNGGEACVIMLHELPENYMTPSLWIKTDSLWTSFLREAKADDRKFPFIQWSETSNIEDALFPVETKLMDRFLNPKPPASVGFWKGLSDLFMIFAGLEINSAEMKEITADMKTHNMWLSSTILFGRCLTVIYSVVNSNKNIELAYEQLAKEAVKLLYSCYAGLKSEEFETEIKASYSTLAAGTLLTHLPSWVIAAVLSGVSIRKNGPTPYYKIRGSVPFTNLAYGLGLTMVGYQCSQAVSFQYGYDFGGICDKNEHCNLWVHTVSLTFFFVALIFFFGLIIAFPSYCSKK